MKSAFVRFAPVRSAPERSVYFSKAPDKSEYFKFELLRIVFVKFLGALACP